MESSEASKPTTELIARGLLLKQGYVLMCRNLKHGYCFLPGGHIDFGEQAADALVREILEETGLESATGPLLLTSEHRFHDGKRVHHEINLVFHMEHIGQPRGRQSQSNDQPIEQIPSIESHIDFVWLDFAQLPEADIRPNEVKAWLMSGGATDPARGPWVSGFE